MRGSVAIAVLVLLGGCFNGNNDNISLGDVSVGQQILDLKRALGEDAITREEYQQAKQALLSITALCETTEEQDS